MVKITVKPRGENCELLTASEGIFAFEKSKLVRHAIALARNNI
jgi:hypothetical protein